ncbi:damage-inducible protein CinA [Methylacidiphilum kamchatkense Kam1]|uniref:CinA-like protein n=1 Tax=Methylacidiphilum kamchatkense Kam1 TaxID=1202785 RepID=A0A0C1RWA2_9BACT|nr:CinA family nicotinamide mononucleotide deamidase-related protein [Methylacidiphilum kamchatkense]KIE59221.1 damage-inducible protein CinA [Methylacidiphilum kamchatkense Kam1]QDQ42818.1 nicotinamide-nucleotide amidase [Methylacidiphilum kamchatkense Kam1]
MRIELINTGTEIILGYKPNTHLEFLANQLFFLDGKIALQQTVGDGDELKEVIKTSFYRSTVTIVTGGLGPTSDDLTREAAAAALNLPLVFYPEVSKKVKSQYEAQGIQAPEWAVQKQSFFPENSLILENPYGTACGAIIEKEGHYLILLPGPPRELEPMWKKSVIPWWKTHFHSEKTNRLVCRIIGVPESVIQEKIESKLKLAGIEEIGYCESPGEVSLRLLFKDPAATEKIAQLLIEAFGDDLYTLEDQTLEEVVIKNAAAKNLKVATAESCTGGLISNRLTDVPGSSAVFTHGWVTYSNEAKISQLKVNSHLFSSVGAVSREVAEAMALGALEASGADLSLAVTGIAGPQGGTPEKPVGLVWLAIGRKGKPIRSYERFFPSDRLTFKRLVSQFGIDLLRRSILDKNLPKC